MSIRPGKNHQNILFEMKQKRHHDPVSVTMKRLIKT